MTEPCFSLYGINLISDDCAESAFIYSEVFHLPVRTKSLNHAELELGNGLVLYFNRNSDHCKVEPGSLTFQLTGSSFFLPDSFFQKDQIFKEKNYFSYLDKYKNRIWFLSDSLVDFPID